MAVAFPSIAAAAALTGGIVEYGSTRNVTAPGPDTYAAQFSEADARIQLTNWQNDLNALIGDPVHNPMGTLRNKSAIANVQGFIDALQRRLTLVAQKPIVDHPTQEWKPAPPPKAIQFLTDITAPITNPVEKVVDNTESLIRGPPLPDSTYTDFMSGPNPVGAFWELIRNTRWTHPLEVLRSVWNFTGVVFDYVIWDFEEFVRLFKVWDGTVGMFLHHPTYLFDVVWRVAVTGLMVAGAVMSGPLLMVLTEWVRMIIELIRTVFRGTTYLIKQVR